MGWAAGALHARAHWPARLALAYSCRDVSGAHRQCDILVPARARSILGNFTLVLPHPGDTGASAPAGGPGRGHPRGLLARGAAAPRLQLSARARAAAAQSSSARAPPARGRARAAGAPHARERAARLGAPDAVRRRRDRVASSPCCRHVECMHAFARTCWRAGGQSRACGCAAPRLRSLMAMQRAYRLSASSSCTGHQHRVYGTEPSATHDSAWLGRTLGEVRGHDGAALLPPNCLVTCP